MYPKMFHPHKGGIERVTDLLCREFINRGHNVFYLNNVCDESLTNYSYPASVFFFPYSTDNINANGDYFVEFLLTHKIDIVVNQDPMLYHGLFYHTVHLESVHVISVVHNTPLWGYAFFTKFTLQLRNKTLVEKVKRIARVFKLPLIKRGYLRELELCYRESLIYTDLLCLLSLKFIPELKQIYKGDLSKVIAIANPNTYPSIQSELFTSKKKQLLYVGRIEWYQKRADRLVYIWKQLYKKFPDWELIVVGDGPIKQTLELRFSSIPRVSFVGYQEPRKFYQDASILCLTSDFEGWGMVLTEAMTFGTVPVLFDSFAAVTDIVDDGKTGLLVPPFSLKKYIRKLSGIMSDDCLRMEMSQASIQSVKKFDIKQVVDKWEDVFQLLKSVKNDFTL